MQLDKVVRCGYAEKTGGNDMEIERKFLTKTVPFAWETYPNHKISQCYISTLPTIRLRQMDTQYILTVKGKGHMAKEEFELLLTKEEYEHLKQKAETQVLEKVRYQIPIENGLIAELDMYKGHLQGLMTTEVEFSSVAEAEAFMPPAWFGKEITEDVRYKNIYLAKYGIPD